jgi:hypothetical protein
LAIAAAFICAPAAAAQSVVVRSPDGRNPI